MIVLAGLDHIDAVFTEFVGALEGIIRNGTTCRDTLELYPRGSLRLISG